MLHTCLARAFGWLHAHLSSPPPRWVELDDGDGLVQTQPWERYDPDARARDLGPPRRG